VWCAVRERVRLLASGAAVFLAGINCATEICYCTMNPT
jgi:hypothetical protein